jgi:hypothetical protein
MNAREEGKTKTDNVRSRNPSQGVPPIWRENIISWMEKRQEGDEVLRGHSVGKELMLLVPPEQRIGSDIGGCPGKTKHSTLWEGEVFSSMWTALVGLQAWSPSLGEC